MDIRTLPDKEQGIYNSLRERYSLHFEVESVGPYRIRLLKPSDLEELLGGRDPFEDVTIFPFWARLWESAAALAQILVGSAGERPGRLLELGAGLGLPGLAAAYAGYEVVLSDYEPHIIDFQQVSRAANNLPRVSSILLDWLKPPQLEPFDVICGAEILFREEFIDPLLDICKNYLMTGGVVYLAHDVRRKCLPLFLRQAEADFVIGSRKMTINRSGQPADILVNRLQRRS